MASVNAPTTIIGSNEEVAKFLEPREPRPEVIDVTASIGVALEGKFILPGNTQEYTEYASAQEMIAAQPPMPDPIFEENDVRPMMEAAGVPLGLLDEMDVEFKKMYQEMFSRTSELGVMGAGDFEARLLQRQNELSESKGENPNGGSTGILSTGGPTLHAPERPATPFHFALQIPRAGAIVSTPEERGDAGDTDVDDRGSGSSVDS
jgi:hypothetical protein